MSSCSVLFANSKIEAPRRVDLGPLPRVKIITKEITFENKGTTPLEISSWSKSCGCTELKIDKTTLAPEEKANLMIIINAESKFPGNINIVLFTNDPKNPKFPIQVNYEFYDPLIITPAVVYIDKAKNVEARRTVELEIKKGTDYGIDKVAIDTKEAKITHSEIKNNQSSLSIVIPSGMNHDLDFKAKILPTKLEKYGDYEIPIKVRMESDVKFSPKKLIAKIKEKPLSGIL